MKGVDDMDYQKILEARSYIERRVKQKAEIAIILGSGLGALTDQMTDVVEMSYNDIAYFKKPTAEGHAGTLVAGYLNGVYLYALKGRYHYYEGFPLADVTFPVKTLKTLGVKTLIITNSCGAINTDFKPGELMLITDHLNMTGTNPLIGKNIDELGPRFPDASEIYTSSLRKLALDAAKDLKIKLHQGVYAWWSGPSYETPAEIRMLRTLGADTVGMSTVPEALVASHMGLQVLGLSCLTNMASGILKKKLSHEEVLAVAQSSQQAFSALVTEIIQRLAK